MYICGCLSPGMLVCTVYVFIRNLVVMAYSRDILPEKWLRLTAGPLRRTVGGLCATFDSQPFKKFPEKDMSKLHYRTKTVINNPGARVEVSCQCRGHWLWPDNIWWEATLNVRPGSTQCFSLYLLLCVIPNCPLRGPEWTNREEPGTLQWPTWVPKT